MPILKFELGTAAVAWLVIHAQEHCRRINVERGEDRTAIRADGRGDIVFGRFIPEGPVIRIVDIHDLRRVVRQRFRTRGLLVGVGGRGVGFLGCSCYGFFANLFRRLSRLLVVNPTLLISDADLFITLPLLFRIYPKRFVFHTSIFGCISYLFLLFALLFSGIYLFLFFLNSVDCNEGPICRIYRISRVLLLGYVRFGMILFVNLVR